MTIGQYLQVLRARWVVLVSSILVCTAGAAVLAWTATPIYEARTQLFVANKNLSTHSGQTYEGGLYAQLRARTYAEIASSPRGAEAVIDDLGLPASVEDVQDEIRADVAPDSVLINVSARDPSPQLARAIANSLGDQLPGLAETLERPPDAGRPPVRVTVTRPARLPTDPVAPQKPIYLALGALLGLVAGIGGAVLLNTLDRRIRSDSDVRASAGAPVLARIAQHPAEDAPIVASDRPSAAAEGYRVLRANLRAISAEHDLRSFVVSSAVAGEGKTEVVANLGLALAQSGERVAVIDANLRSPELGARFGMRSGLGLTDVLEGRESIEGVLGRHPTEPLAVLTGGSPPANPSELLDSEQFDRLLGQLAEWFDFIVVDTPALLPVADAATLARRASGVILVARAASTSRDELRAAREALRAVEGRMLGVVLNRARERDRWLYAEEPPAPRRPARAHPVG